MKVDFWFALKQAAWAVGNLRNPHHNAPGGLDGTNGLGRFGAVVCDLRPKSVEYLVVVGEARPQGAKGNLSTFCSGRA